MKFKNTTDDDELEINLTPLIDIVFLLLIFFMVSTTFTKESQLQIKLPQAEGEKALPQEVPKLIIEISALGVYAVKGPNDKAARQILNTSPGALQRVIRSAAENQDKDKMIVIIRADRKTPHEAVVRALSIAGRLGLTRITFATESQPGDS
ncbi:colicin uptake protein TolR [bacterium BMS3Bbin11]|nr:colicin uptake protein TolR [bacterium BMS3Abin11]GBE45323.1 colicin uptake protein TolR [bacterium BMS3Bbin11]GMT40945.1 MAG: biopolymer transporter ExbD [bacterium]HDH16247.1 biopolymer transporter ExbD [Gammaproteobacteria bacterium]HDZ79456.1 biopolymer transporter ExbD [Gammaproteobacteria bacterium]